MNTTTTTTKFQTNKQNKQTNKQNKTKEFLSIELQPNYVQFWKLNFVKFWFWKVLK